MSQSLPLEARVRRVLSRSIRPVQATVRRAFLHTVDSAVLLRLATPNAKRVLIVRLDNIGDFVMWLHAARALVEHFHAEGRRVTLLGSAAWASFAADLGLFDEVLPLDQRRFRSDLRYRRKMLTEVRATGFGTAVQPTVSSVPEMGDAVVRVCGATERIGVALPGAEPEHEGIYTRLITADPQAKGEMEANARVVRELTGSSYQAKVADLRAVVERVPLGTLAAALPSAPYVVLFPGASAAGRQWPAERFAALARRCVEEWKCPVVLCGGPGDAALAAAAAEKAAANVTSLAGKTSLQQLAAVIARAQLLVSNETSAIHIAAAVGVPSVCILGGGHFGRFVPYPEGVSNARPVPMAATRPMECFGCNWTCKFHPAKGKPMPCIDEITVDAVWTLAGSLFQPELQGGEA